MSALFHNMSEEGLADGLARAIAVLNETDRAALTDMGVVTLLAWLGIEASSFTEDAEPFDVAMYLLAISLTAEEAERRGLITYE